MNTGSPAIKQVSLIWSRKLAVTHIENNWKISIPGDLPGEAGQGGAPQFGTSWLKGKIIMRQKERCKFLKAWMSPIKNHLKMITFYEGNHFSFNGLFG